MRNWGSLSPLGLNKVLSVFDFYHPLVFEHTSLLAGINFTFLLSSTCSAISYPTLSVQGISPQRCIWVIAINYLWASNIHVVKCDDRSSPDFHPSNVEKHGKLNNLTSYFFFGKSASLQKDFKSLAAGFLYLSLACGDGVCFWILIEL